MKKDKKKLLYTVYSAVFVGMCLVPLIFMPFSKADDSKENRSLAEVPNIKTNDGKLNFDFFSEFETYFSEHFAFRQKLVTLDGKIRSEILGTSSNEDVIIGKDGWLYYTPTADDFMNINTLSDRAVNNINHNLLLFSNYCKSKNAYFIFTIAPNKNSIYPEYMPYNYIETDSAGNYEKFSEAYSKINDAYLSAISSSDSNTVIPEYFNFVDLKSTLLNVKKENDLPIYHKTDTHWNNIGALAGRNALIGWLFENDNIFSDTVWTAKNDWSGDLAEMIYPDNTPLDTQLYADYNFTFNYVGAFHNFDDISIKTMCDGREGNLLMYRDSFGAAIIPFMAESFGTAEFSRAVPYNTYSITDDTIVVLEIVERNLGNLQKYAPVMPAPEYSGEIPGGESCDDISINAEESGTYFHIYGELGEEFFKDASAKIIVTCNGKNYEAFNCFEDELLGREDEVSDNGFSLYIPKNDGDLIPDVSAISVAVISGNGEIVKYNQ